jgi:hypothetical protein
MIDATRIARLFPLLACTHCVEPNPNLETSTGSSAATDPSTASGDEASSSAGPTTSTTPTTGADADTSGDTTGSPDESSTGAPAGCSSAARTCVPAAPEGWSGPGAIAQGDNTGEPPACPASFEAAASLAYAELVAPPAQCDCTCDPINPQCDDIELVFDDVVACDAAPEETLNDKGTCSGYFTAIDGYYAADPPVVVSGACGADPSSVTPPAEFSTRTTLCLATPIEIDEGCAKGELCAAVPDAPFEAPACIWNAGDVPCPVGSNYEVRTLLHQDIADTRGCTACECGAIGGTCSATIEVYDEQICGGAILGQLETGAACEQIAGNGHSARVIGIQPEATCGVASGAQPAGAAVPDEPITVCCAAG